jgi:hypothetical protein
MSFFDKFRRKPEYVMASMEVPMSTILRWYLYDTAMAEVNEISELIGLTPVSEEGDLKEEEDSENRLLAISTVFPYLDSIADMSANVLTTIHLKELGENGNDDMAKFMEEELNSMKSVYKAVALSTLVGAFSIANHLQLIHIDAIAADTVEADMEMFDE